LKLFGKKKPQVEELSYEIFGGATIKKMEDGYEVAWKGSHPMSIKFSSLPEIDNDVKTEQDGQMIRITSHQCKLKVTTENGGMKASITEL